MLLLLLRVGFLSLPNYLGSLASEVWRETLHQKESRIPSSCLWPIDTPFSSSFSSGSSLLPRSLSSRSWIDVTIRRQWKSLTGVSGKELTTSCARSAVFEICWLSVNELPAMRQHGNREILAISCRCIIHFFLDFGFAAATRWAGCFRPVALVACGHCRPRYFANLSNTIHKYWMKKSKMKILNKENY